MELRIFVFCIDSTTETKLFVVAKVTEFYTRLEETLEFARDGVLSEVRLPSILWYEHSG